MAVPLSNHSLFLPLRISPFSKPIKTIQPIRPSLSLRSVHLSSPSPAPFLLSNFPVNTNSHERLLFTARVSAYDDPSINGQEGNHQNNVKTSEADQKQPWNLKYLIEIYKEAILSGDERIVSEIEATIRIIENENNELAQKVSALSAEVTSGKEKYIRLQADFDNFRKRSEKERINIRSDAQGEVIEGLLPMVDSFERAKQQLKPETDMEKKIDTSYQGIYKQFVEIMRSLQVAAVATVGKPFDPSLHEAIAREASEQYKEGIIIQEFRRGFILGDRLIRPAMVKVSSGPGPGPEKVPVVNAEKQTPTTAAGASKHNTF